MLVGVRSRPHLHGNPDLELVVLLQIKARQGPILVTLGQILMLSDLTFLSLELVQGSLQLLS